MGRPPSSGRFPGRPFLLAALLLAASSGRAEPYTVQPGDTLSSLARRLGTTAAALAERNGLPVGPLRVGQVLDLPPDPSAATAVSSPSGVRVSLPASAAPGDPVTVRVSGTALAPTVTWGEETLVVARDGAEWVAVGRELLGTRPKTVAVVVRAGDEELRSSLRLRADPRDVRVPTLRLAASIVAGLNDANRAREQAVLAPAYARRTPVAWTRPFALPLQGAPTVSAFGSSRRYSPGGPVNYHYGEDLVAPSGTPVRATNDGTVVIAGTRYEIRGNLVGVDHGAGVVSLYFHLSRFDVKVGQKVRRGQTVGRVGTTGVSTGPHLHWEMRVRGETTDPMQWVGKRWP